MKHVSFVFQVMSAKFLPRLDLLSIMPLTVQKVLIQNIVEVIKGALHLNIQLFDQFWYLVNTVGKINQELATVAETIAMSLFDGCLNEKTKDLYETTLSIFNQIQTKRVNGINLWPNIKEQECYPATKSNPNHTCRQSKQDATCDGDQTWERPLPHLPQESPWQCGFNFHDRHCFELCEEEYWPATSSTGGSLTTKIDNMTDLNFSIVLPTMWT